MNLRRLLKPALIVPAVRSWGCPRVLRKNTVVAFLDAKKLQSKPSPVDFPGEQLVAFADEHGKLMPGWLRKGVVVSKKHVSEEKLKLPLRAKTGTNDEIEEEMTAFDKVRDLLWRKKMTVRRWWKGKVARKAVPRPILRKAIREFDGEPDRTDGTRELQEKLLTILGSPLPSTSKEDRMAAKKAAKKTARKPVKATRSRKQAVDDEDEDYEDDDELEDSYDEDEEDEEDEDEDFDDEEDDEDEEEDERPRRSTKKVGRKAAKKAARKASSNGTRTSMLSSVGRQVLQYGAAVRIAPEYKKLAEKMRSDKPLSVKSYDKLVEHLRERRDATKKLKTSDAEGLKKALRGVRMCQAKAGE